MDLISWDSWYKKYGMSRNCVEVIKDLKVGDRIRKTYRSGGWIEGTVTRCAGSEVDLENVLFDGGGCARVHNISTVLDDGENIEIIADSVELI